MLGRRLAARFGAAVLTTGTILSASGLLSLALVVGAGSGTGKLVPPLVLIGLGNGLVIPLLMGVVLAAVPADSSGAVAGVLTTTMQLSLAVGIALMGLLFFPQISRVGMAAATSQSLFCDLGLVVIAAVLSLTLARRRAVPVRAVAPTENLHEVAA